MHIVGCPDAWMCRGVEIMFKASSRATGALIAILAMASCDVSDATAPYQSISIAVSPVDLIVLCGTTGVTTATLTRGGDFDGNVTLAVSGLPQGVTAFLSPSELAGTNMSTTITIVAEETAPPGSYTITLTAMSSIGEAATNYRLEIVEVPHFHMSVEPSELTVPQGRSGTATVRITRRGGFWGSVALSVANTMSGLEVTLDPEIVHGNTSTVTLSVATTVPTGSYTLTVAGAAEAIPTGTSIISLNVRSPVAEWYPVADPPELTVVRGNHGLTDVHVVTEEELPGWATYSLVNPPAGIYAVFEYHFDWGYPATAIIVVPNGVAAGQYMLTLAATFPGIETKTTTIGLTVKDP
jgi:hypothetical protein